MKRSAFTLVELLVVIVVIGLLAAILMVAVGAAREAARRGQCITRQRDLAIAMADYSVANNGLPGYLNQLGATPPHSWVVAVMPGIGETKRYEVWMRTPPIPPPPPPSNYLAYRAWCETYPEGQQAIAPLPALLCPSHNPRESNRLSYVVNCGPNEQVGQNITVTGDQAPHFTLFKDRRTFALPDFPAVNLASINIKVPIEDIPDGASNTILLSENVDDRNVENSIVGRVWHDNWTSPKYVPNSLPTSPSPEIPTRSIAAIENLGFVWTRLSSLHLHPNSSSSSEAYTVPNNIPRPLSRHPGTVVVAYADGRAEALNDDIAIDVWLRLVCPDDERARLPVNAGGLGLLGL